MKVAVIGVSEKIERYSNMCVRKLLEHGYEVLAFGNKAGVVEGVPIITEKILNEKVDTITLYISPGRQTEWYEFILKSKPRRLIMNPGTENNELANLAIASGIKVIESCTLMMLTLGSFEDDFE